MAEWPWRYTSSSKVITHDTPPHASNYLCHIIILYDKSTLRTVGTSERMDTMDHKVMSGQTDKWTRWINTLPLICHWRHKYNNSNSPHRFLAATKQLCAMAQSVCPSICLSITIFSLRSHHRIIMKISGVITINRSDVHTKGQGQDQRWKSQRSKTKLAVSGL